jgi:hypothetical protein
MPVNQPGQEQEIALSRSGGRGGRIRLAEPAWVTVGLVCLALAGTLTAVVVARTSWVQPADRQWLRWMLDTRAAPGVSVAKVLNVVAGGTIMWIVRLFIAAALALWRRWRA